MLTKMGLVSEWIAFIAVAVVALLWFATPASAINKRISTDPLTGVALEGYDAVSYFTNGEPLPGRPEFEYYYDGVPWYFSMPANRDAFARSPTNYMPMFGGYGAMSLARGFLSAGNPRVYAVVGGRLFLFYSTGNRDAFLMSPRASYIKAQENWLVQRETLSSAS